MAIQEERKIYPQLVVPPPTSDDQVLDFCQNIARAYEDLSRQIHDKFNAHAGGSHAHPAAWKVMRLPRPKYTYDPSDNSKVIVPASTTQPVYFVIGEARQETPSRGFSILEATSDLECDLDASNGAGGLDEGSMAANTIYYLYGVNDGGSPALIASDNPPSTGPTGFSYGEWTYIGAFETETTPFIVQFHSANGFHLQGDFKNSTGNTNSITAVPKTLRMPTTAEFAHISLQAYSSTAVGYLGYISGESTGDGFTLDVRVQQVSTNPVHITGFVPHLTQNTFWMWVNNANAEVGAWKIGWIEDPTRWP
ncbi:hypothetical protein ACFL3Q_12390 [Planctomycetota bacterium]